MQVPNMNKKDLDPAEQFKLRFYQSLCQKCQFIVASDIVSKNSVDSNSLCNFCKAKCERFIKERS